MILNPETITVITALIAGLTGSGLTGLIQFLITRHDRQEREEREKSSSQTLLLLGLAHDRLLFLTDRYVERGGITLVEKRNLAYLYEPYKEVGGNGDCKIGYDSCQDLPVISREKADELDRANQRRFFRG